MATLYCRSAAVDMIPRVLSVAGPLWVYASLAVLAYGLWHERRKLDWRALVPAALGLAASAVFLSPVHRLFFDEDIYINIAGNLTRTPVNQVTVLGGPDDAQISSYYKEPAGWPVLLSLAFFIAGRGEPVAFWFARILFAVAIAAVYHLARELLNNRLQAVVAAVLFGAAPVCFWFSVSPGTDIPAALFATLGTWGVIAGNGPLAAAGFALAAQTRMELLILMPLVWIAAKVPTKWKTAAACLVAIEIGHVAWVMSLRPELESAERISSAFSLRYIPANVRSNLAYLFNPFSFIAVGTVLAIVAMYYGGRNHRWILGIQACAVLMVYFVFYAGSFDVNPRYSIQMLVPIAVLSASLLNGPRALLLLSIVLPYMRPTAFPAFVQALAADHRVSAEFASQVRTNELVLTAQPEMFINEGRRAMNAVFASKHPQALDQEISQGKVWYHAGVRTNPADTEDALADRWVKSNYELHLIQSQEISGFRVAFYEVLLKRVDREARLVRPFESERDGSKAR